MSKYPMTMHGELARMDGLLAAANAREAELMEQLAAANERIAELEANQLSAQLIAAYDARDWATGQRATLERERDSALARVVELEAKAAVCDCDCHHFLETWPRVVAERDAARARVQELERDLDLSEEQRLKAEDERDQSFSRGVESARESAARIVEMYHRQGSLGHNICQSVAKEIRAHDQRWVGDVREDAYAAGLSRGFKAARAAAARWVEDKLPVSGPLLADEIRALLPADPAKGET